MGRKGRYVYGVADSGKAISLGTIGVGGAEVYTLPCGRLCAIVHSCPAEPYRSTDEETVKLWVGAHQRVLDVAKRDLGTVVPVAFDTILQPGDDTISPDQVVRDWLEDDCERLQRVVERIRGKDEYGVRILCNRAMMTRQVSERNEEIRKLREEMKSRSPGMAYLYKQKAEKAVKAEIEKLASQWFTGFYARLKRHCDDVVVEKTRKVDPGKVMLLNLSCLVAGERLENLGEELGRINDTEGFSVHFSGPWPPYSFVARPAVPVKERAG